MSHQVFVSYSDKDKEAADAVCAALESNGICCWIAPRDIKPGEKWATAIGRAIDGSKLMALVFSGNANDSEQINREVSLAAEAKIAIAPIRVEDVKPEGDLKYYLTSMHWMDAVTPPLEKCLSDFAVQVGELLKAMEPEKAPEAPPIAVDAAKPIETPDPGIPPVGGAA